MAINWVNVSLWGGGVILILAIISFLYNYLKEKRIESQKQQAFPQQQQFNPNQQSVQQRFQQQQPYPQQNPNPMQQPYPVHQMGIPTGQYQGGIIRDYPPQQIENTYKNPYPEGTQEWYAIEMLKIKQLPTQEPKPAPNPYEQDIKKMIDKIQELDYTNRKLMETEEKQRKIIREYALNPSNLTQPKEQPKVSEPKQIESEPNPNEIKSVVKISIPVPELADENFVKNFKELLEKSLQKNFKNVKKELEKDGVTTEIEYEIF